MTDRLSRKELLAQANLQPIRDRGRTDTMSDAWILIIWVYTGVGPVTQVQAEFDTHKSCAIAAQKATAEWIEWGWQEARIRALCLQKNIGN